MPGKAKARGASRKTCLNKPQPGQPTGFSNPQLHTRLFHNGLATMVLPRWYEGLPLAALKGKNGSPFPKFDGKGDFHSLNSPSETEEIMHRIVESLIVCVLVLTLAVPAIAGHHDQGPAKQAIVLAAFGTSYPEALKSILNIRTRIPLLPVQLAHHPAKGIHWRERGANTR